MALSFFRPGLLERDLMLGCGQHIPRFNWLDLDIDESATAYTVSADLPGFGEEDVNLEIHEGMLSISADKKIETQREGDDGKPVTVTRSSRSFRRAFTLPEDVDENGISAKMDKGVLTLGLPKKPKAAPRRIVFGGAEGDKAVEAAAPSGAPASN